MNNQTDNIPNTPQKVMKTAWWLFLIFIILLLLVPLSGIEGKKGGYALMMLLFTLGLSSLAIAIMFRSRSRIFKNLIKNFEPLAHWSYSKEEWYLFLKETLFEMNVINKIKLRYVSLITIFVGIILLVLYRDLLFIPIIFGILMIIGIAAWWGPQIQTLLLKRGNRVCYIGRDSIYIGGSFYIWTQLGAHLTGVSIYKDGSIPILHIIYEFPTLQAMQEEIIRIPVPYQKMEEANNVVRILKEQIEN